MAIRQCQLEPRVRKWHPHRLARELPSRSGGRRCWTPGVTPRATVDCMIAAVVWRRGAALLAYDARIDRVAHVNGMDIDEGFRRPSAIASSPRQTCSCYSMYMCLTGTPPTSIISRGTASYPTKQKRHWPTHDGSLFMPDR